MVWKIRGEKRWNSLEERERERERERDEALGIFYLIPT
jgi:hypothetical protein